MLVRLGGSRRGSGFLATATCVLVCGACASSGSTAEGADPGAVQPDVLLGTVPTSSNPNVLTGDQLREVDVGNAYDALRRLRPQWLRARGATSLVSPRGNEAIVYVSGIRRGDLRTLQNINIDQIRRIEFIDARDATTRFGTGHTGGVIMVDLDRN